MATYIVSNRVYFCSKMMSLVLCYVFYLTFNKLIYFSNQETTFASLIILLVEYNI